MSRRWAWVLAVFFGLALAMSCTLDLGPVLEAKAKDAGTGGDAPANEDTNQPDVFELPPGCLNTAIVRAQCDPFSNAPCMSGLGCDTNFYTQPRLSCLPNDGLLLGEPCNQTTGPYCAGKFTCTGDPGVCANFCCTNSECPGGFCLAFDINLGTLGFCSGGEAGTEDADGTP